MRELWLMIRHPWKVRRYLKLEGMVTRGIRLTWAANHELSALRLMVAGDGGSNG